MSDPEPYSHLDEDIKSFLCLSDVERIERIGVFEWFHYGIAKELLIEMEMLLRQPNKLRSQGLLIIAPPNNGKTTLVHYFAEKYPVEEKEDGTGAIIPVVFINSPHKPDVGWFLNNILLALNAPHKTKEKDEIKFNQVIWLFDQLKVRLLIVDEISDIVDGTALQQRHFLNMLKNLNNRMKRPIILTGTSRIKSAIAIDEQVNARFAQRELIEWQADLELIDFLAAYEKRLPLKLPSKLTALENRSLALNIVTKSRGRIGYMIELLQKAAIKAIVKGKEKIDSEIIDSIKS